MIAAGRRPTALVVAVPEASGLVRLAGGPGGARRQLPPHVTVLWPFLAAADVDRATLDALAGLFAAEAPFDASFATIGAFPDAVYLAPDDPSPFVALTGAVARRWPDRPPYEGRFASVVPHVTLRFGPSLPPGVDPAPLLPVTARVGEVLLARWTRLRGWRPVARFPLGATPR